jgi:hypothetical protein
VDTLNNIYAHRYKGRQRKAASLFVKLIPTALSGSVRPDDIEERARRLVEESSKELEDALKQLLNI